MAFKPWYKVETISIVQFGSIDEQLSQIVESLSQLDAKESTQLIWQSSREELLARFEQKGTS